MKSIEDLISDLQKQPYNTRVKILWGTVAVIAIILFALWVWSLKSTIKNVNTSDLIKVPDTKAQVAGETQTNYATVERIVSSANSFEIYFNFKNPTSDILNIPNMNDISLTINGKQINPKQITDRQGNPFVQKILSGAQNFGILVFDPTNAKSGQLTFDQMFFEQNADQLFSQKIQLDFKQLEKDSELRD